jgi:16S rRNA (adenine1518-N6/adenine1519-N6)-dimethyltransferase
VGYKVVANIPYYITGQILRKFLESENKPESMTLLVQKEVAERIVAKNKKESLLSLSVKAFGEPRCVKTINRALFSPQPKVHSAIIKIENVSDKKIRGFQDTFFKIIHAGFKHKRKRLFANLLEIFPKNILAEAFEKNKIDTNIRAEKVDFQTWLLFCKIIPK